MSGLGKPGGHLNKWKIKEVNARTNEGFGSLIDARRVYEAMGGQIMDDEKVRIFIDECSHQKPRFIGDSPDLFDIFKLRVQHKTTRNGHITIEIEYPEQEHDFLRISRVDCPNENKCGGEKGKLGLGNTTFFMSVESGNLYHMNEYGLRGCPGVMIRPISEVPKPDGQNSFMYEWEVSGGPQNYVNYEDLKGGELVNMGALIGEGTQSRGRLEMGGMGRAYGCYRMPLMRLGYEMMITDEAWDKATHFMAVKENCDHDKWAGKINPNKITISDIVAKFHMKAEKITERRLIAGTGSDPKYMARYMDKNTGRPVISGPTFLDQLRASGFETYNKSSFNIDMLGDRAQAKANRMKLKANEGWVIDVITGWGGYNHCIKPDLQKRDPRGCGNCNDIHIKQKGFGNGRQGYRLSEKLFTGIDIGANGRINFHISDMLNDGILSGGQMHMGLPYSSYWMIVMFGKLNKKDNTNGAIQIWKKKKMETKGFIVGQYGPNGPVAENPGRSYNHEGRLGNNFKVYRDFYRGILLTGRGSVQILYPNFR